MSEPERFDDEQVAEILRQASAAGTDEHAIAVQPPARAGLSLDEIQAIAAEVGIPAEAVTRAASSVARGDHLPTARVHFAGLPIGMSRAVELPRALTQDEWSSLVLDLQERFGARGRVQEQGRVREWRNGNLRIVLEPVGNGERLRMSTLKGDARSLLQLAAGSIGLGALLSVLGIVMQDGATRGAAGGLVALGLLAAGWTALSVRSWAALRARQLESLGATVAARLASGE